MDHPATWYLCNVGGSGFSLLQTLPAKDSAYLLFYGGLAQYYLGRQEQAVEHFDRAYLLDPSLMPARVGKALSETITRQHDAVVNLLRQTEAEMEARGVGDAEFKYKVTQAYAVLGDKPAALHMLQQTIEGGFICYPCFLSDPLFASIRSDPEFHASRLRHKHAANSSKPTSSRNSESIRNRRSRLTAAKLALPWPFPQKFMKCS